MLDPVNSREKCMVTVFRTAAEDALLRRVHGEFREMPGMRLTAEQAMRLWSLDRTTCRSVLDSLVATHFLAIDAHGRYGLSQAGY